MSYEYGFQDAARASVVQQHHLDIIANNLANAATAGFKADRLVFNDLMSREMRTVHGQGSLRHTDNPLDLAINGDGFFLVKTKDGNRLTRDGSFKMLANGTLVTSDGNQVLDSSGQGITLNPNGDRPHVDDQGGVYQGVEQVGIVGVVQVADKKQLRKEGMNLFSGEDGNLPATSPAQDFSLTQGSLEMSNVDVVTEMVGMINAHRNFESYQKALQAMQDMDNKTVNQVGRVA